MKDAATPSSTPDDKVPALRKVHIHQRTLKLRVLATTDVHMQFLGHDYVRDRPLAHNGLAGLATMIKKARAEAAANDTACLLLDNGDLLQGAALGDTLSRLPVDSAHPVVRCIKSIGYDAIGVGNHDLDHGLAYPLALAAASPAPFVSSNLQPAATTALRSAVMLRRSCIEASTNARIDLQIGVVSVLTNRTALWNKNTLQDRATVTSSIGSAIQSAKHLRQRGADIVILLAHLGVESSANSRDDVRAFAKVPGIDAILAGHTHRRLPGKDHDGTAEVDVVNSTFADCPAVMAGFDASDLGVLDLTLGQTRDTRRQVIDHKSRLRPNTLASKPDPKIIKICMPAHQQTRAGLAQLVGQTRVSLQNYFSLARPTSTCGLLASAKKLVVQQGLGDMPQADLPLLVAVAAHTAGGQAGPSHFLHIPPGPILRRHLAGLSPYTNEICALEITGKELRHWLERAGLSFAELNHENDAQYLAQLEKPTFDFDTIYGLDYGLDPTRPAGQRISHVHFDGRDVLDDQKFILTTNQFRAAGGGGGQKFTQQQIVFRSDASVPEALCRLLEQPKLPAWCHTKPWRFSNPEPVQAIIRTAPEALLHLRDIAHLGPQPLGLDEDGFEAIRLTL